MSLSDLIVPPWGKWLAVGLLIAAIAGVGWKVNGWRHAAAERQQAVDELAAYRQQIADRDAQALRDIALDEASKKELAETRARITGLLTQLSQKPITQVVYRERIVDGRACPDPRIGPEWMQQHNAVAAAASPSQ